MATIGYYAMFSQTFNVNPSIIVSECSDDLGEVYDGEILEGSECVITNNADTKRSLVISANEVEGIETSYMAELDLVVKDTTDWIASGDVETIKYTLIGEEFVVNDIPEGYTLIYYPNTEGDIFTTNVANILVYGESDIEQLPITLDVGDDYCNIGDSSPGADDGYNAGVLQCFGAKLWLINEVLTLEQVKTKVGAWDTTGILFEKSLIQYNAEGNIVLSPRASLTITPVYEIGAGVSGEQTITTKIA